MRHKYTLRSAISSLKYVNNNTKIECPVAIG